MEGEQEVRLGRHVPALDGLRGVAILWVMLFHFCLTEDRPGWIGRAIGAVASQGWMGVDLFFVLSGFLITGILWRSKGEDGYFRNFYARRSLRIFPLYYAVLLVCFLILPRFVSLESLGMEEARKAQGWLWTYLTNVRICMSPKVEFGPFDAFWSLAVEEHFYLAWPLIVWLCNRKQLIAACGAVMILAFTLRLFTDRDSIYVLTPYRMDELAAGGLLAILAHDPDRRDALRRAGFCALAALAVVLLAGGVAGRVGGLYADRILASLWMTRSGLVFAALLAFSVCAAPLRRVMELRPLRFFGKYSYGLYVYHSLLLGIVFQHSVLSGQGLARVTGSPLAGLILHLLLSTGISLACAMASWHLFEARLLNFRKRFGGSAASAQPTEPALAAGDLTSRP